MLVALILSAVFLATIVIVIRSGASSEFFAGKSCQSCKDNLYNSIAAANPKCLSDNKVCLDQYNKRLGECASKC